MREVFESPSFRLAVEIECYTGSQCSPYGASRCQLPFNSEDIPAFAATFLTVRHTPSLPRLSGRHAFHAFCWRRIKLCDPAKAIGLGIVRPGNKCSAHFRTIPARGDTEPKRLFCLNVTRQNVLHEVQAFSWC
jgi:hypothetical protein